MIYRNSMARENWLLTGRNQEQAHAGVLTPDSIDPHLEISRATRCIFQTAKQFTNEYVTPSLQLFVSGRGSWGWKKKKGVCGGWRFKKQDGTYAVANLTQHKTHCFPARGKHCRWPVRLSPPTAGNRCQLSRCQLMLKIHTRTRTHTHPIKTQRDTHTQPKICLWPI